MGHHHFQQPIGVVIFFFTWNSQQVIIFYSLRPVFIFPDCLSTLSVRTANSNCHLRMFSLFSRLFFTFPAEKLLLQLIIFVLISGISGCLWCLGTQLHFPRMFLIPRPSSKVSSSQTGRRSLCQYFMRLLFSIFPDHFCGCSHHHHINTALKFSPTYVILSYKLRLSSSLT